MDEKTIIASPEADTSWKSKTLIVGAVLGALTGLGAAYLLIQRSEKYGAPPSLSAGEGVKLGLLVFGLLRQVMLLGSGE